MENEYMWKQAVDYAKSEYEHDYGDWDSLEKYEKEDIIFHEYFKLKDSVIIDSDGNECNTGDCVRFILKKTVLTKNRLLDFASGLMNMAMVLVYSASTSQMKTGT